MVQIIALLQRPEGAAISEIVAETGKLGLPVTAEQVAGRGRCYRWPPEV